MRDSECFMNSSSLSQFVSWFSLSRALVPEGPSSLLNIKAHCYAQQTHAIQAPKQIGSMVASQPVKFPRIRISAGQLG